MNEARLLWTSPNSQVQNSKSFSIFSNIFLKKSPLVVTDKGTFAKINRFYV